jgi:hypothetical protein
MARALVGASTRRTLSARLGTTALGLLAGVAGGRAAALAGCGRVLARCRSSADCCKGGRCRGGQCKCKAGLADCAVRCRNLRTAAGDCGGCGTACRPDQICVEGACVCPGNQVECADRCRDTPVDPGHCGGCDQACRPDQVCRDGACGCPTGKTECAGLCRDLTRDEAHCGACDHACRPDQICSEGTCRCLSGHIDCGDDVCIRGGCCSDEDCRGDFICRVRDDSTKYCLCPEGQRPADCPPGPEFLCVPGHPGDGGCGGPPGGRLQADARSD